MREEELSCRLSNVWGEDFQEEGEEEDVELREGGDAGPLRVSALYRYPGEEEGTLTLEPGQQFLVVGEQEDQEGWVRVRRIEGEELEEQEGYIPLAYTQPV